MAISEKTFFDVLVQDQESNWELLRGRLQEKPQMAYVHNETIRYLHHLLAQQLDWRTHRVSYDLGRVARPQSDSYFIPDVMIIPAEILDQYRRDPKAIEIYDEPLPLVVEVWSPSTGLYDKRIKLDEYRTRGDAEIWRLNTDDSILISDVRQPDGGYVETSYGGGETVRLAALPHVSVDVGDLFGRGTP